MAQTIATVIGKLSATRLDNTSVTSSVQTATGSSTVINQIIIDNSNNSTAVYLKLYNTTGSVTVGTTDPACVFPAAASEAADFQFSPGLTLDTGIKYACVQEAGTAGTTNPSNAVVLKMLYT